MYLPTIPMSLSAVCDIFEEIIGELQKKQPAYERLCVSKLFALMSVLERKTEKESSATGRYFDKISFVIQKMNREYYMNCTLDDYAGMCNMSRYHFLRIFRSITGRTPIEYRNEIRFNHIKEQLEDTDIPIGEIGRNAGFTSASYFCDSFCRRFSMTPTQYRNRKVR